jgi:4-methylaminobutanoate oxidase (formaldehyde-forming)
MAGVRRIVNGPIPYSADGEFVMGRAAEWENVFIAAGFLYGIAAGGGAGRMMAEWIAQDAPSLDLWPLDLRRFTFHHGSKFFLYRRAAEHYAHHYKFRAPDAACQSARGLRRSPLYYPLKARGARYFEKAGWERPGWFSPGGKDEAPPPYLRAAGFARIGAECRAARKHAVLIDQSSFAKIEIRGPDAPDCLERIAAARIKNRPIGAVVYTPLCNERGGIEADVTITRFCGDGFYIVTGAAFGAHNFAWIKSRLPAGGNFFVNDVTSAFAVLNLAGPRARKILATAAEEDVSNEAFPFASCRDITLGAAPARAMRVGYTGELGFELHIPAEFACHVYEHLLAAGEREGIADAGYGALESLRLEKGYVYWSRDVSPLRTPFEAGLGRFVALDKDAPFIGKEALARQKAAGVENKLCLFAAQTDALLLGGEAILCGDKAVGYATSAGYGHCVKKNLAIGYLPRALWTRRNFQIEAYGERYPLRRLQTAAWDSRGVRLRA